MRVDHLPLAVSFRPYVGEAERRLEPLAAINAAQSGNAAHDGAVAPNLFDWVLDYERLELVTGRCKVRDELRLVLDLAGAADEGVVVSQQSLELCAIAVYLCLVVGLNRCRQVGRQLVGQRQRREDDGDHGREPRYVLHYSAPLRWPRL